MINTGSLSNQALKSVHPSLLCCPLLALRSIQWHWSAATARSRCACLLDSGGTIWLLWVYRDPVGIKIDSVGTSRRKWPVPKLMYLQILMSIEGGKLLPPSSEDNTSQLAMRRRATSSQRWHPLPRSRSHTQCRADVGSRSQAAQSAVQRGLKQWTQSVLASSLDRRQGDPRQMAKIRKLRVNLQFLKSK